jgi:hypothetical protein
MLPGDFKVFEIGAAPLPTIRGDQWLAVALVTSAFAPNAFCLLLRRGGRMKGAGELVVVVPEYLKGYEGAIKLAITKAYLLRRGSDRKKNGKTRTPQAGTCGVHAES